MLKDQIITDFNAEIPQYKLFGRCWKVPQQKAVVCIIHGFGEHIGRYLHVADYFNEKGITCYAIDLPGHGKSTGKRGFIKSLQDYILAVDSVYEKAISENENTPVFIYGHSMGGGIVLRYLQLTTIPPAGALITSPWLRLVRNPNGLEIVLGRIAMNFGINTIKNTKLDLANLSRDLEVGKKYTSDELVHNQASLRLYFDLSDNGTYLMHKEFDFRTKILLAHGTADQITDYRASKKLAALHPKQIEFKSWEGLKHETHNELNKQEVLDYYTNWILQKIEKAS